MTEPTVHTIEIERRYQRDRLMDIIGHPPGWLMRSGIGVMACMTVLFLYLAWCIHYPDIIEAPVVITSDHPPMQVYTNHAGIIDSIYIREGDEVTAGQILLYMDNTARLSDVVMWKDWLASVIQVIEPDSMVVAPPISLSLGELHPGYTTISQKYQEWYRWVMDESVAEKIKANHAEIKTIKRLMASLAQQITIYDQELELQDHTLHREQSLYQSGVISAADHEKSTSTYLAATRQKESIATGMLTHQMRVDQLESLILDESIAYDNQLLTLHTTLKELCREELASIGKWEDQYIVRSKISGTISLPGHLVSRTYINTGDPLLSVLPVDKGSIIYARASVAGAGLGKIGIGDKVIIRLDAWPYKQFGSIASVVEQIAQLPLPSEKQENTFELRMSLAAPLVTTTGASLLMKPQETGTARIITKDRRILERLFDQLLQLTHINS